MTVSIARSKWLYSLLCGKPVVCAIRDFCMRYGQMSQSLYQCRLFGQYRAVSFDGKEMAKFLFYTPLQIGCKVKLIAASVVIFLSLSFVVHHISLSYITIMFIKEKHQNRGQRSRKREPIALLLFFVAESCSLLKILSVKLTAILAISITFHKEEVGANVYDLLKKNLSS